jgi:hypothetical protein
MPKSLTFANRFGHKILDNADDVDDDHDSDYDPSDDSGQSSVSSRSYASSASSSDDSDDDDDDDDSNSQPISCLPAGVGGKAADMDDDDDDDDEATDVDDDDDDDNYNSDDSDSDDDNDDGCNNTRRVTINVKDEVISSPKSSMPTGVGAQGKVRQSAGVGRSQNNTLPEITGVPSSSNVGTEQDDHDNAENANKDNSDNENETEDNTIMHDNEMDALYGPRNREGLRDWKPRSYSHRLGFDHSLATFEQPMRELFLTEQMNVKKGLKVFGESGADAIIKELRQLDRFNTIEPQHSSDMTQQQRQQALRCLMYLKQK